MEFSLARKWAIEMGFCDAGICRAADFTEQRQLVACQPELKERKQLRFSPGEDDARLRSILVLLWPYQQAALSKGRNLFVDSYYAASNAAYHAAVRLEKRLDEAGVYAKANVPYPAKEAAVRAGLGLIGHNSLLIHPQHGSRVVIILIATDLDAGKADMDKPRGPCLSCGKCVSACPSGAIDQNGMSHPERCLRNFMMEGEIVPERLRSAMGNRLLGCDMCQRVCPMQRPSSSAAESTWKLDDFSSADPAVFRESAAKLASEAGRNIARPQRIRAQAALLCGNVGTSADLPILRQWAQSEFEAVRVHAQWAIKRIQSNNALPEFD